MSKRQEVKSTEEAKKILNSIVKKEKLVTHPTNHKPRSK